jgi:hypothetical protein
VFQHARLPLHKMLQAIHLMVSSRKGISAHQLARILEVQYKSAWFLAHRIRGAMRSGALAQPFGSGGGAVGVDEPYIGFKKDAPNSRRFGHKRGVLALVDRDSGQSRWFHIESTTAEQIHPIVASNISREARLMTERPRCTERSAGTLRSTAPPCMACSTTWTLRMARSHANTVEGAFSIFKRGGGVLRSALWHW